MKFYFPKRPEAAEIGIFENKEKIKNILMALIVVLAVGGTFLYLSGKNISQESFMGGFQGDLFVSDYSEKDEDDLSEEETKKEAENLHYYEEAQAGDGMTHIARRAFQKYSQEKGISGYTDEHKVFVEDYIQKKLGGGSLELDEEISISTELISEAIQKADSLTEDQLSNLKQYSSLVSFS